MHRRGPIAIGILLSLSFFGGLQSLLLLAKNTVATVAPFGPPPEVHPDLSSPAITAVVSAPVPPTEPAPENILVGAAGLGATAPAIVQLPASRPVADSTDPVEVSPKPIPVAPPPVGTPPAQPAPPAVAPIPEQPVPVPVPVPPVQIPQVPGPGGTTKPPTSSIPLSTTSPPTSTSTSSHPYPESSPPPVE